MSLPATTAAVPSSPLVRIVPTADLERTLGTPAYRVLSCLNALRRVHGEREVHPTVAGLAREAGLSRRQAKRALATLRRHELVRDVGWQGFGVSLFGTPSVGQAIAKGKSVPCERRRWVGPAANLDDNRKNHSWEKVYRREVVARCRKDRWEVPGTVSTKTCECGCGEHVQPRDGNRGRLPQYATPACRQRVWRRKYLDGGEGEPAASTGETKIGSTDLEAVEITKCRDQEKNKGSLLGVPPPTSWGEGTPSANFVRGSPETKTRWQAPGAATPPSDSKTSSPQAWLARQPKRMRDDAGRDLGLRMGGTAPLPNPFPVYAGVPPFPGMELLRPVVVPPPAKVPESMDSEEAVELALRVFEGALAERLGRPRKPAVFRFIRRSASYSHLVDGVEMLRAQGWTLAAWAAFSIAVWYERVNGARRGRVRPPPLAWVYQQSRIVNSAEEFLARGEIGPRVVLGPLARELVRRWQAMERELRLVGPRTAEESRALVAKHCGADWAAQVQEARAEGQRGQVEINQRIAKGEFVWGV